MCLCLHRSAAHQDGDLRAGSLIHLQVQKIRGGQERWKLCCVTIQSLIPSSLRSMRGGCVLDPNFLHIWLLPGEPNCTMPYCILGCSSEGMKMISGITCINEVMHVE